MAKVGVRIEGSETLSPAAQSAAKSLRALREETEGLKKGAQNILQPLINLRSTIMGIGASAGIIAALRGINSEIKASIKAYADQDAEFKGQLDHVKELGTELRAMIGEKLAPVVSALATAFGNVAQRILDVRNNAELAAKAMKALESGEAIGSRYMSAQGPEAAYFGVPQQLLRDVFSGMEQLYALQTGDPALSMTWQQQANAWLELQKVIKQYGLEQTGLGQTLEWLRVRLWAQPGPEARTNLADFLRKDREDMAATTTAAIVHLADVLRKDREDMAMGVSGDARQNLADFLRADRGDLAAATGVIGYGGGTDVSADVAAGPAGDLAAAFTEMLQSITSIQLLMDPFTTMFKATLDIIGPLVDTALTPLVGILVILGQLIGTLLMPVIEALSPIIELVGHAFVWLYNNIIRPVGTIIYKIFTGLGNMLKVIVNAIISVLQFLGFAKNVPKFEMSEVDPSVLPEISYGDLLTAGGNAITAAGTSYGGTSGSKTTVEHQPDIYLYLTIEGSVYGAGGPKVVGEEMARALEAYAGIGGRIHIEGALT